jgi:hypothetical protein
MVDTNLDWSARCGHLSQSKSVSTIQQSLWSITTIWDITVGNRQATNSTKITATWSNFFPKYFCSA